MPTTQFPYRDSPPRGVSPVAYPYATVPAEDPVPILVAVDGDDCTGPIVRLAETLAIQRGAAPSLLYAMELTPAPTLDGNVGAEVLSSALLDPSRRADDERRLRTVCHADVGPAAAWPFRVEVGDAATYIVQRAWQNKAQLILMGAHRHGAISHLLGTDTVRNVMSVTTVPVLAARPELTTLPRSIVVATDFSRASLRAALLARQLLADDGTMYLVFVSNAKQNGSEHAEARKIVVGNGVEMAFDQMRDALAAGPRQKIIPLQCDGDPVTELKAVCETRHPDLVAIGSQRHPFLERLFVGSVARAIAGDGRWSVLVTPPSL